MKIEGFYKDSILVNIDFLEQNRGKIGHNQQLEKVLMAVYTTSTNVTFPWQMLKSGQALQKIICIKGPIPSIKKLR